MKSHLPGAFFGIANLPEFFRGIQLAVDSLIRPEGIYAGDNLFTFNRNLSFLDDEKLMASFNTHATEPIEQTILWRVSIVTWAARNAMRLEGDLVECACYKGTTARIVCDYIDLASHPERSYYLYDLFEHDASMPHHALPAHGGDLFGYVKSRFADVPNVRVTRGRVPDVLAETAPAKIAFMHIDMNNAEGEIGALEVLFDRMVPGAVLILDDYGWNAYSAQKKAEDPWLEARGYRVMELPTGQGMVIK